MVRGAIIAFICTIAFAASCESEDPWKTTCELYEQYEEAQVCENLEPPKIKYEEMAPGLMGYYDGGDTIHISRDVKGQDRFAVILHEMVHYLDAVWGGLKVPGPAALVCKSEDKAWFLEGVWWGMVGKPQNARPDWWKSYPHCWPYFAPAQGFTLTLQEWINIFGIGEQPIWVVPK